MGSYIKGIALVIILLFFITFGVKNSQAVQVSYYIDSLNVALPLYGLVYISMVIGIIIGMLMGLGTRYNLKKMVKSLQKENRELRDKAMEEKEEKTEGVLNKV